MKKLLVFLALLLVPSILNAASAVPYVVNKGGMSTNQTTINPTNVGVLTLTGTGAVSIANSTAIRLATPITYATNLAQQANPEFWGATNNGLADDSAALQAMFNAAGNQNITFPRGGKYLVNSTIRIQQWTNSTGVGRIIDGGGATFISGGVSNLFELQSSTTSNLVNAVFQNFVFDGFATNAFVLVDNGHAWDNIFRNLKCANTAVGGSLLEFRNTVTNGQGGRNTVIGATAMNCVTNTVTFSTDIGCLEDHDNFTLQNIVQSFNGAGYGAAVFVADHSTLLNSEINGVVFTGKSDGVVVTNTGYASITASRISNVYGEPSGNNRVGVSGYLTKSSVDGVTLFGNDGATGNFGYTGTATDCDMKRIRKRNSGGGWLNDYSVYEGSYSVSNRYTDCWTVYLDPSDTSSSVDTDTLTLRKPVVMRAQGYTPALEVTGVTNPYVRVKDEKTSTAVKIQATESGFGLIGTETTNTVGFLMGNQIVGKLYDYGGGYFTGGNWGINTNLPQAALHVVGTVQIDQATNSTGTDVKGQLPIIVNGVTYYIDLKK